MAVNDRDPAWAEHQTERDQIKALMAGKSKASAYVVALPGWDATTLEAIKKLAYYLPMVARTAETFGGLVFAKAPTRDIPAGLEAYLADVTQSGQEMDRFAEQAFDAVLTTGAGMVLVDYPAAREGITVAQAEAEGVRPVLRLYDASCILSARATKFGTASRLTHVRVLEVVDEPAPTQDDPFALDQVEQVRVLELLDGAYVQTVWRHLDGRWQAGDPIRPRQNNAPMPEIPAFFFNARDGEPRPMRPPLSDIADVNVAHLQNSAQYEWGLAWLGAPTLFGAGIELSEGSTIQMGASSAVVTPNADARLEIVQADANSLSGLKVAMDDKRRDAAALGARMLMEESRQALAAETARIQRAGELSVVGAMANSVSEALTKALRFMAEWAGVAGEVEYWLNTQLLGGKMDAATLAALLSAWQSGAISKQELFARLQEGEVVDPAKSFEDMEEEIAGEFPPAGMIAEAA